MNAKTQYDNGMSSIGMSSIAGAQVGMSLTPKLWNKDL